MTAGVAEVREEALRRMSAGLCAHVEAVAATAEAIARAGGWPVATFENAARAAWIHDAVKEDGLSAWLELLRNAGEEPDSWSLAHAPILLHAPAAAAWAAARGEDDAGVLEAVRHHPTAKAEWGTAGRILFVSDFCEPTRDWAAALDTERLRALAGEGEEGLAAAAARVLGLRLRHHIAGGFPVHPESVRAWNRWMADGGGPGDGDP